MVTFFLTKSLCQCNNDGFCLAKDLKEINGITKLSPKHKWSTILTSVQALLWWNSLRPVEPRSTFPCRSAARTFGRFRTLWCLGLGRLGVFVIGRSLHTFYGSFQLKQRLTKLEKRSFQHNKVLLSCPLIELYK